MRNSESLGHIEKVNVGQRVFSRMSRLFAIVAAVAIFSASGATLAQTSAQSQCAFLVSFDHKVLAPRTVCDGEATIDVGRIESVVGVLFGQGDSVTGSSWKCVTQGTQEHPGKLHVVNQMNRPKAVVLNCSAPPSATVKVKSAIGELAWRLSDIRPGDVRPFLDGVANVRRVPKAAQLSNEKSEDEYPSVVCDDKGTVWSVWQSWDEKSDTIYIRKRGENGWSNAEAVTQTPGDYYRPTVSVDGANGIWVVWSANVTGNWDLYGRRLSNGKWSEATRFTTAPGTDFNQKTVRDASGGLWMVWQAERDGQFDVFLAALSQKGLRDVRQVTEHTADDWDPAIAVGADGKLFIAWDTYRNGSYDVYLRELAGGKFSPEIPIAAGPDYEAHPSIACDRQGRVWIAWDNGGPEWGLHSRRNTRLHGARRVVLRCFHNGKLFEPAAPLAQSLPQEVKGLWELPHIVVDGRGNLWALFRNLGAIKRWNVKKKQKVRQTRGIWSYFAVTYNGEKWSAPALLPGSGGRNDQRLSISLDANGSPWIAWSGDGRNRVRAEMPINHNVLAGRLDIPDSEPKALAVKEIGPTPKPVDLTRQRPQAHTVEIRGERYCLVYGDTHRHTDISRCNMNHDGSLLDTYRYAIDVVKLDFIGISDHDQDILKHRYDRIQRPLQTYAWQRSQKLCDLFTRGDSFIAIYGYEHGGSMRSRGGHKNIMYSKRGMPCIEDNSPEALFKGLEGKDAVAIPHQLADGGSATDWEKWNGQWETVAELFQARGSYEYMGAPRIARVKREGHFLWDALGKGVKIGVIASSDHGLTHSAYAGVYVKEKTRRGIIDALRNRRAFGATDTIILDLRIGEHFMGEAIEVDSTPVLKAEVRGTWELKRVDICRDGKFIYTADPDGSNHAFEYADESLQKGESCYYYLRCVQDNNELAWSSPIWVRLKGDG